MLGEDGFKRAVALKVLNPDVAETGEVARRFRDEARVLGLLRHRAIVQVDGLVHLGDRQALVMEFIDGADLGRIMALGPIPVGAALEIVGEVANALDVAVHTPGPDGRALGLLHRDVKPSNIRITPVGEVKVLDFGVARADFGLREAVTKSYLLGSNGYMGPERFEGDDEPATDIYSLGVVLLEMVTGRIFGPTSIRPAKLAQRVETALVDVEGIPDVVAELIHQMMSFEAYDRPSAGEVERRVWDMRRTLDDDRLRDWARVVVAVASSKKVETPIDDLSGQVLVESKSQAPADPSAQPGAAAQRPQPSLPVAVVVDDSIPDPGSIDDEPLPDIPLLRPTVETSLPDEDEWDDDKPTVVVPIASAAPAASTGPIALTSPVKQLRRASNLASVTPKGPETVRQPFERSAVDRTPLPRPRPIPQARIQPDSSATNRTIWMGASLGAGAAVLLGTLVVLSMNELPQRGFEPAPSGPFALPVPEPAALDLYGGPEPTETEGSIQIVGDAPAVRLVSVNGRRHAAGLVDPGTYLISADFGGGPTMAGRFDLSAGERLTVDCSVAALACTMVRED
jgi:serine/threonine protein kinase